VKVVRLKMPIWAQRHEKRERKMKGCVMKQKVNDWQMNARTLWTCDIARVRRGMVYDQY